MDVVVRTTTTTNALITITSDIVRKKLFPRIYSTYPYYPPKENSLKNLSGGSHWFEYSFLLYVVFAVFFVFLKDPSHLLCGGWWWVVGGGWGVFLRNIKKKQYFF